MLRDCIALRPVHHAACTMDAVAHRQAILKVYKQLAELHEGITFIKVEAEAVPEVTLKYDVAMVPTFVLIKSGAACGKLEGADPPELSKRIQAFAREGAPRQGPGDSGEGLPAELSSKLRKLISASPVMLFMKGSPKEPNCKSSRKMVEMLRGAGVDFGSFDILADEEARAALKIYSSWSTYPQLYVKDVLIGGVDETVKLAESGDLKTQLALTAGVDAARSATAMRDTKSVQDRCRELMKRSETMLFMKGNPDAPQCGFSRTIVALLHEESIEFDFFDILQDQGVRKVLKEISNWPTYPQLYVRGDLIGGLDIIQEMKKEGPLAVQLGIAPKESLDARLKRLTSSGGIMLFMKGTPDAPQCGFSRQAVALLRDEAVEFDTFDILEDDAVRQGLKKLSNWPTYPQLYAGGELLGGLDIMKEMTEAGELAAALKPRK